MWYRLFVSTLVIGILAGTDLGALPSANAQISTSTGLVSPLAARRSGLERIWSTHIEMNRSRDKIAQITIFVSAENTFVVHELVDEFGKKISITERDLNTYGEPLGPVDSQRKAVEIKDKLQKQGRTIEFITRQVPEVTLYVVTAEGTLQAIDAETGRTLWQTIVGTPRRVVTAAGVNEKYVALTNGTTLHVFDRKNGRAAWQTKLKNMPGAGPALSEDYIFVPMLNGRIEYYDLKDHTKPVWVFQGLGAIMNQPTVSPRSLSWATDRGCIFVARPDKYGLRFRFEANEAFYSGSTFQAPNRIFGASADGYIHALNEMSGDTIWRFSTGEATSLAPIPIGDTVYAVTDAGSMYAINSETGDERWVVKDISQFVSASKTRVYCRNMTGRIVVLDTKTGGLIATMQTDGLDLMQINQQTDRIYIGTSNGSLQCLREINQKWPTAHMLELEIQAAKEIEMGKQEPDIIQGPGEQPGPGTGPGKDPFENEDKPDDKPDDNPFEDKGGGNNPFEGFGDDKPAKPPVKPPTKKPAEKEDEDDIGKSIFE